MIFDVFHSIGRIDSLSPRLSDSEVYTGFFQQVQLAEELGYQTIWVAESHFSSEVQKHGSNPVIPNYQGEVGLNCDSFQLAQFVFAQTKKIGFGTAIHNIVGGNGGPVASADRVRSLAFLNQFLPEPRRIEIGLAQGRFPYINEPFGIRPRCELEHKLWPAYKRIIFLEALEIFLRLSRGEVIGSSDVTDYSIDYRFFKTTEQYEQLLRSLRLESPPKYDKRWTFEPLQLVPELDGKTSERLSFVLGSADPIARDVGFTHGDPDIFNLSFTPPEQLNAIHQQMKQFCRLRSRPWHRSRLPRTVLVFIDTSYEVALQRANECFDTYIEAMRGTVGFPAKEVLMSRALIGEPQMVCDQLADVAQYGFDRDDRLMLWFEFNQSDFDAIANQMKLFADKVMPHFS